VSARLRDAVFVGLASGVAVVTKFSSVPFIGVSLIVLSLTHWAALRRRASAASLRSALPAAALGDAASARVAQLADPPPTWGRRAAGLALAALVGLAPVWLAYGPRVADPAGVAFRFNWAVSYLLAQHGLAHVFGVLLSHLWLPRELKDLVNGIVAVKAHNDSGHLSYLLGETRLTGWWYFYLVALAVKTPIPLLVAGPIGLVTLALRGFRRADTWVMAPLAVVVAILVFASAVSRINIGIRHILIVYPLLALGAADLTVRAWRALRSSYRASAADATRVSPIVKRIPDYPLKHLANLRTLGAAALLAALGWQLSPLWRAWPDYLPYFNELVAHPSACSSTPISTGGRTCTAWKCAWLSSASDTSASRTAARRTCAVSRCRRCTSFHHTSASQAGSRCRSSRAPATAPITAGSIPITRSSASARPSTCTTCPERVRLDAVLGPAAICRQITRELPSDHKKTPKTARPRPSFRT